MGVESPEKHMQEGILIKWSKLLLVYEISWGTCGVIAQGSPPVPQSEVEQTEDAR